MTPPPSPRALWILRRSLTINSKEEVLDEEEEEEYGGQATRVSSGTVSQDMFLTPALSSQSLQPSMGEPDAGEGTSGKDAVCFEITGMEPPK